MQQQWILLWLWLAVTQTQQQPLFKLHRSSNLKQRTNVRNSKSSRSAFDDVEKLTIQPISMDSIFFVCVHFPAHMIDRRPKMFSSKRQQN
jgi:hypothetical protein